MDQPQFDAPASIYENLPAPAYLWLGDPLYMEEAEVSPPPLPPLPMVEGPDGPVPVAGLIVRVLLTRTKREQKRGRTKFCVCVYRTREYTLPKSTPGFEPTPWRDRVERDAMNLPY